jgi:hypothetical protein
MKMRKEKSPHLIAPRAEKVPENMSGPHGTMKILYASSLALVFQVIPKLAFASEGLDVPEALEHKVDLQGLVELTCSLQPPTTKTCGCTLCIAPSSWR